jgi:PKD repeat protein
MNYNKILIKLSFLILGAILLAVGCEKKEEDKAKIPELKTELVSEITFNAAVSGGVIISEGGAEITSKGVLWSEDIAPTIEQNIGMTDAGGGPEVFKSNLTGLKPKTVYFLRAYAKNAAGVGYGDQFNFITLEAKPPVATFTSDVVTGVVPLLVQFTDLSTENPNQWLWEFGDGTTSDIQNPSHIYQIAGTFDVKLTAKNPAGSNQTTESYFIIVKPLGNAPVAEFTALPRQGAAPLTVDFIDQTSNNPTIWKWSFGDGASNTERNPTFTYQTPGNYTVKLEVKNDFGEDVVVKDNYITVNPGGTAPVADFSGTPTSGKSPLVVSFTDLSTNTPTTWLWNFGDGSSSTEKNPSYTYQNPGTYTVNLKAKNEFGENVAV